jgi:hypothetical protein
MIAAPSEGVIDAETTRPFADLRALDRDIDASLAQYRGYWRIYLSISRRWRGARKEFRSQSDQSRRAASHRNRLSASPCAHARRQRAYATAAVKNVGEEAQSIRLVIDQSLEARWSIHNDRIGETERDRRFREALGMAPALMVCCIAGGFLINGRPAECGNIATHIIFRTSLSGRSTFHARSKLGTGKSQIHTAPQGFGR